MTSSNAAKATLLLPPSESKRPGGTEAFACASGAFSLLAPLRREVLEALWHEIEGGTPARQHAVLGARGALADRAYRATQLLVEGTAPVLCAWERYSGVVWKHLDPGELDPDQLRRILIPSGLLGVSAACDPTPDYRLKLSVRLGTLGPLQKWWAPVLTNQLATVGEQTVLVDLLPAEHAAAIDWRVLGEARKVIRVRFVAEGPTGLGRAVGHDAKAAKGRFAAWLLRNGLGHTDAFAWRGWSARRHSEREIVVAMALP